MLGCVECAFILAVWRFDSVSLCCVIEGLGGLRCKAWAFLGGQGDQADLCLQNLRCLWVGPRGPRGPWMACWPCGGHKGLMALDHCHAWLHLYVLRKDFVTRAMDIF